MAHSLNQPRRFRRLANPRDKAGGYFAPYVLAALVVVAVVFYVLGSVTHGGQPNFSSRPANLRVPQIRLAVYAAEKPRALTPDVSINISRYPQAGDQDGQGACAAWATAWDLSYEYRMLHPGSYIRFSARWMYDHFSCTYSGAQDAGSWPPQDLETVPTQGIPRFRQYPNPPFSISCQILRQVQEMAAVYRMAARVNLISGNAMGGGPGLVSSIKLAIQQNHPVLFALPVYPEYDAATGYVTLPKAGEHERGGHENVFLKCSDGFRFPDGEVGGCLAQNQWGLGYGFNGRAWFSYGFIEKYVWGAMSISIAPGLPQAGPRPHWDGGMRHTPRPASMTSSVSVAVNPWLDVAGVRATDRPLDLSPIINAAAHKYHLPPAGLASTFGAECAWATGVGHDCDRWGAWPDVSFGMCQVSVQTAGAFGVGDGSASLGNELGVRAYEENPWNCADLGARVMSTYIGYTHIPYEFAEVAWNCGPGYAFITNPQGECLSNFTVYLGWWHAALAHTVQPGPRFSWSRWNVWRLKHRLSVLSPFDRGRHFSWAASVWTFHQQACGGVQTISRWWPRSTAIAHGYSVTYFERCIITTWPDFHRARVVPRAELVGASEDAYLFLGSCLVPFVLHSPTAVDAGLLVNGVDADTDYMLYTGMQCLAHLPGGSWHHYVQEGAITIPGSGTAIKYVTPNGGHFAFLHIQGYTIRFASTGGEVVGLSRWPDSPPYCNGGYCGPSDAHLCIVSDARALAWFRFLASGKDHKPLPRFRLPAWNEWRVSHHARPISPYYCGRIAGPCRTYSWPASIWRGHQWLRGVRYDSHGYGKGRGAYSKTGFRCGAVFTWSHSRAVKVVRTRCLP